MRIPLPLAAGTLLAACNIVPATNTTDPTPTCVDGPSREFGAQNRYSGSNGDGTWGLAGTVVKIERDGASSFFSITNAERDGMSWNDEQDTPTFQRRCTADEIARANGGDVTSDPAAAPR